MKSFLIATLCLLPLVCGFGSPVEIKKESKSKEFDPVTEIKTFYQDILENNPTVKKQFIDQLKSIKDYHIDEAHFGPSDPQVIEWYPSKNEWDAETGFHFDKYFLVIQPYRVCSP
jgi:hypothetical protein